MKEICKLAQEKGFKAKTFSTIFTYNYHLGIGKNIRLNDTCDYLLLCEIQKWIREELFIHILLNVDIIGHWYYELYNLKDKRNAEIGDYNRMNWFETYEEVLKAVILEILTKEL